MILIVDSFFTGSHQYWGKELKKRLPFEGELLTLSGKFWKWRMEAGAIELAEKFKKLNKKPSCIIATDMVNIPLFYAYAGITIDRIPCIMYFHENQFSYPLSKKDTDIKEGRDNHYGFINLSSALFTKNLVFNSLFNQKSFFDGCLKLFKKLPNHKLKNDFDRLKSRIIYPGIESNPIVKESKNKPKMHTILWNHRWEHDKNPDLFLKGITALQKKKIPFKLIITGKGTEKNEVKRSINAQFHNELIHCGYCENKNEYLSLLQQATLLPVTSKHDFFGISVAEAMDAGCFAILPNHQAYPEHLENNFKSGVLYDYPEGFYEALIQSVGNDVVSATSTSSFYWEAIIAEWTELLQTIEQAHSSSLTIDTHTPYKRI